MVEIIENPDAPGDTTTAYTITPGNPGDIVFGDITTIGDVDWFNVSFEGKAGYTYWITAKQDGSLGGLEALEVTLLDDRTNVINNDTGRIIAGFTLDPLTSGNFYISVEGDASAFSGYTKTGTYTLDVLREVANNQYTQAKVNVDGRAYKGSLDYPWSAAGSGSDVDWVGVDLEKGQTYFFSQTALDGYTGLGRLYLVDRNGTELRNSSGDDYLIYTADANQTYFMKVTGYNRQGQFKVQVESDVSGNTNTRENLEIGETFKGSFRLTEYGQAEYDWYRVELKAGINYQIDLIGGALLELHNKDGVSVIDWNNSTTIDEFNVSKTGIYYINAGGHASIGDYKLSFGIVGERYGTNGDNTIRGGASDNIIRGRDGNDRLLGQNGNDTLDGQVGDDTLVGGRGNDVLLGGDGNDTLKGGGGKDRLDGGTGNDKMTGGGGADTFIFSDGNDRITDFNAANNREKIDLSNVASIRNFKDLKNNHLSEDGGNVVIDDAAGNTLTLNGLDISDLDKGDFIF